ncbi:UNKNOWN [Stylonychia lemnae]|uniref:Uncharacterized protein n=1 Tax=Stylonychia lemnae TaxID=5949 RepID=A0A078ABL5_STYLE|nr:UNKNOWN [Stylonychia lemnae]|eukprot:CDW79261.1 UNKNOWN [Stylonychia lemnae]
MKINFKEPRIQQAHFQIENLLQQHITTSEKKQNRSQPEKIQQEELSILSSDKSKKLESCDVSFSLNEINQSCFQINTLDLQQTNQLLQPMRNIQLDQVNPRNGRRGHTDEDQWLLDSLNIIKTVDSQYFSQPRVKAAANLYNTSLTVDDACFGDLENRNSLTTDTKFIKQVNQAIDYFQNTENRPVIQGQRKKNNQRQSFSIYLSMDKPRLVDEVEKLNQKLKQNKSKNQATLSEMQRHISHLANDKMCLIRDLNEAKIQLKEAEIKLSHFSEMYCNEKVEKDQIIQAFQQYLLNQQLQEPKVNVNNLVKYQLQEIRCPHESVNISTNYQSAPVSNKKSKPNREVYSNPTSNRQHYINNKEKGNQMSFNNSMVNPNKSSLNYYSANNPKYNYYPQSQQFYSHQHTRHTSPVNDSDIEQNIKNTQSNESVGYGYQSHINQFITKDQMDKTFDKSNSHLRYSFQNPMIDPSQATPQARINLSGDYTSSVKKKKQHYPVNIKSQALEERFESIQTMIQTQRIKKNNNNPNQSGTKKNQEMKLGNKTLSNLIKATLSSFGRKQTTTDTSTIAQNPYSSQSDI